MHWLQRYWLLKKNCFKLEKGCIWKYENCILRARYGSKHTLMTHVNCTYSAKKRAANVSCIEKCGIFWLVLNGLFHKNVKLCVNTLINYLWRNFIGIKFTAYAYLRRAWHGTSCLHLALIGCGSLSLDMPQMMHFFFCKW